MKGTHPAHFFLIFLFVGLFFITQEAEAAILYFDIPENTYSKTEGFSTKIRVNNEEECINAANVDIHFPSELLQAKEVDMENSILQAAVSGAIIDNVAGRIQLAGGIWGKYCGRTKGDLSFSNILGEILFELTDLGRSSEEEEILSLSFNEESYVLLHDGAGTFANLSLEETTLSIKEDITVLWNGWKELLKKFTNPLEDLMINKQNTVVLTTVWD